MTKIVCIGAGSFSFGLSTLITLLQSRDLDGSEICLVDHNQASLDLISELANWLNSEWDCHKLISNHANHQDALKGANFVINSTEVTPREQLWEADCKITDKDGLRQPYGENGGPGGFAHAARNVAPVLAIARDMEKLSPDAWLINFTNPMHRLCYLVNQYTKVKVVGLCHQLGMGYAMVAKVLAERYQFKGTDEFQSTHADPRNHVSSHRFQSFGQKAFKIKAAGLNHFSWMLDLQDRSSGENLYPAFRAAWENLDPNFEPLTHKVFKHFGLFPIPGDEHLCEYLPWLSNAKTEPWKKYDCSLYDWDLNSALRDFQWDMIKSTIASKKGAESLRYPESEGALEVITGLLKDEPLYWEAVNIPNAGLIPGLSPDTIVEVPAIISRDGICGEEMGEMPKAITGLLQREALCSQLCIDAVVHGDRHLAMQSLLLDPVINDIDIAENVLIDILEANKAYLPQFGA
jgi:alpha-galactosidase